MAIPALHPATVYTNRPLEGRAGLLADRLEIESFLERILRDTRQGSIGPVPLAMEYSIMGGGQRIRPILALRVARLLNVESDHARRAATAVEVLHCASLIVDDLPCMDDEGMRRGRKATHIQFGEPTALLASFCMVAMAARICVEAPASDREYARLRRFQLALLRTLDCSSLVGGQSLDLTLNGKDRDEQRSMVNAMKTAPLFRLAVEAGCVSNLTGVPPEIRDFGQEFGLAFQLTDDYIDGELKNEEILHERYEHCRATLHAYGDHAQPLLELVDYLQDRSAA